jgi:type VI secretion system secreted protein VgrG
MDTNVKNDATSTINGNNSHYVRKNELLRVETNQTLVTKGKSLVLTGKDKLEAVSEQYVVSSGTRLLLASGESAIELLANGTINLIGNDFNFFVKGDGHITTKGKLYLNADDGKAGVDAPGERLKGDIDKAVEEYFTPERKIKRRSGSGAAAGAPKTVLNRSPNPP